MITYFKDKNNKSEKKYQKYKTLTTILKSFDTLVKIATTSFSFTLNFRGIGLIARPKPSGRACGLMIGNEVVYKIIMQKYNKYKKQCEKDQQNNKSFDKLYGKYLQDIVIDRNEYESFCSFSLKMLVKLKMNHFLNLIIKRNLHFFSNNKLIFNLEPRIKLVYM